MTSRRRFRSVVFSIAIGLLLAPGCAGGGGEARDAGEDAGGDDVEMHDLTLIGSDFEEHEGAVVHIAVVQDDPTEVMHRATVTVADGGFEVTYAGVLEPDRFVNAHFYIDVNESGACDAAPDDHGGTNSIPVRANGDVSYPLRDQHSETRVHDCAHFE